LLKETKGDYDDASTAAKLMPRLLKRSSKQEAKALLEKLTEPAIAAEG
jgi:hypothetical protein